MICKDLKEKKCVAVLLTSSLLPVHSCLKPFSDGNVCTNMLRAVLEIVAAGAASSVAEVTQYLNCTLFSADMVCEIFPHSTVFRPANDLQKYWAVDWSIDWLIDSVFDALIVRLIDWLIDWLSLWSAIDRLCSALVSTSFLYHYRSQVPRKLWLKSSSILWELNSWWRWWTVGGLSRRSLETRWCGRDCRWPTGSPSFRNWSGLDCRSTWSRNCTFCTWSHRITWWGRWNSSTTTATWWYGNGCRKRGSESGTWSVWMKCAWRRRCRESSATKGTWTSPVRWLLCAVSTGTDHFSILFSILSQMHC